MSDTSWATTPENLSAETIRAYRQQGFVHIPGIISRQEAEDFRAAALDVSRRMKSHHSGPVFTQLVNAWREDEKIKQLTLHPNVAALAECLAGMPLRLWHDHILIKQLHNNAPTEFHQDLPFWPHSNSQHTLSAWIALVDVPVERGCMTFIPGSQHIRDLEAQNLRDAHDLFDKAPDLAWEPRITLPLHAGDCTFHHGLCAHMATPNTTDEPRVAHVIIFMDANTTYRTIEHVVTDPLQLRAGQPLDGELFPRVAEFSTLRQ